MFTLSRRSSVWRLIISPFAACALISGIVTPPAHSYPGTSPSARAAARLKYRPPAGWIQHYLGDDRYKIKGGSWKVVSTELDQFYYPPWAPEMLRQPAGIVIGFSSVDDAEEAGYRRSNYPMDMPTLGINDNPGGATSRRRVTTLNTSNRAIRIILADGVSTVSLPPNWRRTQSGASTVAGRTALSDTLQPIKGRGFIRFAFINAPVQGMDMGAILQPGTFETAIARINRTGNSQQVNIVNNMSVRAARVGSLSGVAVTAKPGRTVPGLTGRGLLAGRGSKAYFVEDNSRGSAGASGIIASFQPR